MSRLFLITLWVAVGISVPIVFLTLVSSFMIDPLVGVLGLLFAVLYLVVLIWLLSRTPLWPDFNAFRRLPNGKKRRGHGSTAQWVTASVMWGALVSFGIVMLTGLPVLEITTKLDWDFVSASFGGAYPEEIAKSLGIVIILLSFRQLNRPWHGLVTGALVGIGFEVNENILYGATGALIDANSDLDGLLYMWGLRTVAGPLIHTILSAFAGYGIGLALFRAGKSTAWRWGVALAWVGLAFALHFAWNLLWSSTVASIINIIVISSIMYPLIAYLIWRNWRAARADQSYVYTPLPITTVDDELLKEVTPKPVDVLELADPKMEESQGWVDQQLPSN